MGNHTRTLHRTSPSACGKCNRQLANYKSLYRHNYTQHEQVKLLCTVDGCNATFVGRLRIQAHWNKSHRVVTQPRRVVAQPRPPRGRQPRRTTTAAQLYYACTIPGCGLRFAKRVNLTAHWPTHTSTRFYQCDHCQKLFQTGRNLLKHVNQMHQPKRYRCGVANCQYRGYLPSYITQHIKRVHREIDIDSIFNNVQTIPQ